MAMNSGGWATKRPRVLRLEENYHANAWDDRCLLAWEHPATLTSQLGNVIAWSAANARPAIVTAAAPRFPYRVALPAPIV
jgi:hypothetical protein